jgi:hypothetical protein
MNSANTVLPIVEEELQVGKRRIESERIQVRMLTDLAEELVRQELAGEHLEVERVPIDSLIEPGADLPRIRTEGSVTIFPVLEEAVVVETPSPQGRGAHHQASDDRNYRNPDYGAQTTRHCRTPKQ